MGQMFKYIVELYGFLGSALPLYTAMLVRGDQTKVNATSTEPVHVYALPYTALQ